MSPYKLLITPLSHTHLKCTKKETIETEWTHSLSLLLYHQSAIITSALYTSVKFNKSRELLIAYWLTSYKVNRIGTWEYLFGDVGHEI